MSLGSITSLGVGSGFELQEILENCRAADEVPIQVLEEKKTKTEERLAEFDVVNTKLLTMKSHALALSLKSNFIEKKISISAEDVATATVLPGTSEGTTSMEVVRLATKSSWQTAGAESENASIYIPTIQESDMGFTDTDKTAVTAEAETMTITYGSDEDTRTINVDFTSGMTLDQIVSAVNSDSDNKNAEDNSYVTASTFEGEDGNWYLRIESTAEGNNESNRVMLTTPPTGLEFSAPDKTFSYQVGEANASLTLSIAADTSITQLAELINNDENNLGITASVINDGSADNPYRLILTADETGETNRIFISGLEMNEVQGADNESLNAEILVDGITYQRQKNTGIDDILQGITLNIKSKGSCLIDVTADNEPIESEVTGLIESFNELVQEIRVNSTYDESTEEWGTLSTTSSIKSIDDKLITLMSTVMDSGGSINSMYDLGMTVNRDGTITLDDEKFNQAINSHAEDIINFFIGNENADISGLADIINDKLRDLTKTSGVINSEKDAAENEIERLESDIESATERLDRRYETLARQFVLLDSYLGQVQSQSDYLSSIFDSFNSTFNSSK